MRGEISRDAFGSFMFVAMSRAFEVLNGMLLDSDSLNADFETLFDWPKGENDFLGPEVFREFFCPKSRILFS